MAGILFRARMRRRDRKRLKKTGGLRLSPYDDRAQLLRIDQATLDRIERSTRGDS